MSLQQADLAQLLLALTVLLVVAHMVGQVFALLRQPPVIGEIMGGLLLGPTVFGLVAPDAQARMFPTSGVTGTGLGVVYELGLLLLLFLSGREVQMYRGGGEQRTVAIVAAAGLFLPFLVGLAAVRFVDYSEFSGPHGTKLTFALVFGIAIAVTSIPVISRIMLDLGILDTRFARVVLYVAVVEDVILYVALAVTLGLARANSSDTYGLWTFFHSTANGPATAYYVLASLAFFAFFLTFGDPIFRMLARSRLNLVEQRSPVALRLAFLLALVLVCVFLGIDPIFGALVAGIGAASADSRITDVVAAERARQGWDALKGFSMAFFVPLYFAGIGIKLDLVHHFTVVFFIIFLLLACVAKLASVWAGARLAGENSRSAVNLAIALNARGGPGIVLATVTLSAGVINEDFFTVLVLLSIVTSQFAGFWLQRVFQRQRQPAARKS